MEFSDRQLERYSRHLLLKEIGVKGQEKLLKSRVLVIGIGGLGSPTALYLAAAGVGTIGLADPDSVELSNLQRQIIHTSMDVGKPKTLSGQEKISRLNEDVETVTYHEKVEASNIKDIMNDRDYQFIIEATDNFPTKFLVNDVCVQQKKAFSHGGITKFQGQTMTYVPERGACYRCVFQEPPDMNSVLGCKETNCQTAGVLGVLAGTIGTIQATEAVKYLLGIGDLLCGYMLTYDALSIQFRKVKLSRREGCRACGSRSDISMPIDGRSAK